MSKTQAMNKLLIVMALLIVLLVSMQSRAQSTVQQNLNVSLYPSLKMLKADVKLTFPKDTPRKLTFLIHKDLKLVVTSIGDAIRLIRTATAQENYSEYGLELSNDDSSVSIQYHGVIHDPVVNDNSRGLISPEGVALFGSSYWYPSFANTKNTFEIRVETPATWKALTQGQIAGVEQTPTLRVTTFKEIYPQEDLYLVAGPFFQFEKQGSNKYYQVLLRKNEPALAQTYLDLIPGYIQSFSEKIGPYPYAGFTVVENFWETGFGMPSFTLLGPSVIRLPYILNSSLPHEILHNWWGNGVYVDTEGGNWSEGLTTYMADHAGQEELKQDRTYRLNTLMNYQDYVMAHPEKDFALKDFRARDSASSQAVGYGKSLFLFHMLEVRTGKDLFKKSLQDFYQSFLFKNASFQDIRKSFEKITQQDLSGFFEQWVGQKGAPLLHLENVQMMRGLEGVYNVTYKLRQDDSQPAYDLIVPIKWTLENGGEFRQTARLSQRKSYFSFSTRVRPMQISVDPELNIFRQLHVEERPATLSALFGSKKVQFFFDAREIEQMKFAQIWGGKIAGETKFSDIAAESPNQQDGDWVLIGDHPQISELQKKELRDQKFSVDETSLNLNGEVYKISEVSSVVVTRSIRFPGKNIIWVRWAADNNPREWAERLTHYGPFGILVFKGRPVIQRGTWPVVSSPLQKSL